MWSPTGANAKSSGKGVAAVKDKGMLGYAHVGTLTDVAIKGAGGKRRFSRSAMKAAEEGTGEREKGEDLEKGRKRCNDITSSLTPSVQQACSQGKKMHPGTAAVMPGDQESKGERRGGRETPKGRAKLQCQLGPNNAAGCSTSKRNQGKKGSNSQKKGKKKTR